MSFHALETPKPMVSRKGRKRVKLVPAVNPVTCSIQLQILLLKDIHGGPECKRN